jgi:hypothetical protein
MKKIIVSIAAVTIVAIIYYQIDYKRHFIGNKANTEFITIWQRVGNNCYIIPGKYYWMTAPKDNYIKTVNYRNYIGVVWDTYDKYSCKISIYNKFETKDLETSFDVYSSNDSLLLEYHILDTLDIQKGKRIKNPNADSLKRVYDYNYLDLNRIYGIRVYKNR